MIKAGLSPTNSPPPYLRHMTNYNYYKNYYIQYVRLGQLIQIIFWVFTPKKNYK